MLKQFNSQFGLTGTHRARCRRASQSAELLEYALLVDALKSPPGDEVKQPSSGGEVGGSCVVVSRPARQNSQILNGKGAQDSRAGRGAGDLPPCGGGSRVAAGVGAVGEFRHVRVSQIEQVTSPLSRPVSGELPGRQQRLDSLGQHGDVLSEHCQGGQNPA